jgi:RNA polymerase sigma factor (sigma-70 family)
MANKINLLKLSDQELLIKIKEDSRYLGVVEKRFKSSCVSFVRWKLKRNISEIDLEEMFQDACLVLYENIVKDVFFLTHSLQTYLHQVCYNNMMNRLRKKAKIEKREMKADEHEDFYHELPDSDEYDSSIADSIIKVNDVNSKEVNALKKALEKIKNAGGNCYELLTLFWYPPRISMKELTEEFGYSSEVNTRNQKAKCQKRLKIIMQKEFLNGISY